MSIKRFKLILGIIIPFLSIFLMSQNTFAIPINSLDAFQFFKRTNPANEYTISTLGTGNLPYQWIAANVDFLQVRSVNFSVSMATPQSGNYFSGNAYIVMSVGYNPPVDGFDDNGGYNCNNILEVDLRPSTGVIQSESYNIDSCITRRSVTGNNIYLRISGGGKLQTSVTTSQYYISIKSKSDDLPFLNYQARPQIFAFITIGGLDVNFNMSSDPATMELREINQSIINIYNEITDQNELENSAILNIENQTASDIPNATNAQTTSLLGVISSFIGALTSIDTTGNCQLTLPFPEFVGGDTIVNPCNGKDKAPAIVQVFSSLFLIGIFVPLAWLLIRMIYKEIRTWTNG